MEESGKAPKLENELPVPTGPELLVLVPEVAGSQIFQVNRFRTNDDAAAFIRTSVSPKLLPSTHVFWARHECPTPGDEPTGGEALVLIRADTDQELVQIVSLVDLPAATSFVRFEAKRGLDPASVMIYWASFSPLAEEVAAAVTASAEEPEMPDEAEEASAEALDEAEEPAGSGSLGRWALIPVAGLLLLIGGVFFLGPTSDGSGDEETSVAAAAVQSQEDVPGTASPPTATTAPPPSTEAGDAAAAGSEAASSGTAGNEPAGADAAPAPTANTVTGITGASAPPPPTATPKPTPTPLPRSSHVGDLDGSAEGQGAKKTKLLVKIVVHDAAHRPVAGATISGEWTGGASGPASCVTASDGSCVVASKPLNSGVRAKFSISGIMADGLPYNSAINHDLDGDSNGTSITVEG